MAITSNPAVINGAAITAQGINSFLNISAATAVKSTKGRIVKVNVTTAGSAPGSVYDRATTSGTGAANLVASIPNTVGSYTIDFPCANGIVVTPGTGQVVSVSFN
jgi:hypothetical protein